jgi:hypothetical protein
MWEVYTSKRAYAGLPREAIIERVYKTGLRPRFPSTAPAAIVALAEACWNTEPGRRPAFSQIAEALEAVAAALAGQGGAPAGAPGGAAAPGLPPPGAYAPAHAHAALAGPAKAAAAPAAAAQRAAAPLRG